ncbi:putative primosomal protein N' [Pseudoclavibacter endophyticus]|uniref:Probable replication restart protein PriA n=1 Tax=Pseudoclavibacter endophyticus TaxID=1778590 RepID=A0A6H9WMI6_9MICO|nr:primosomal protein N' [Pseudoclavibacter endophyticus]KAB1650096.1 primosomal protein N' [Pseudoclavibacter endophyticus]GGA57243.1 putative primosomal protein N' [Pseudoclavibacter endophyticus]
MTADVAVVVVASPLPQLDREFEYRIPEHLKGQVGPGMRVRVPVRSARRTLDGFVLRVTDRPQFEGTLSELDALLSPAPVLTPAVARLARAVADRQAGTTADVLRLAIPTRRARVESEWLAARGDGAFPAARQPSRGAAAVDDRASVEAAVGPEAAGALTGEPGARVAVRAPVGVGPDAVPNALGMLADIAAAHVRAGRGAIMIVPDFRDVELGRRALLSRLDAPLVRRADAAAKPTDRYRDYLACLDGPVAIIGTRSAVYAPVARLGVVLVWDDADESYVEPLTPYPHTREVALERQRQEGCTLVLASHAPSLEAQRLVELGWLTSASAVRRPPRVVPSDAVVGDERLAQHARIPSIAWRTATDALRDGPVLVQVARAGYVPRLACGACREAARCRTCGGPLRLAARSSVPRCTVCGAAEPTWHCGACGGATLRAMSVGVGRTAEELGRAFPGVPVIVADGETRRVEVGDSPALVVATRGAEPAARGGYRAVLLLDGERLLAREALDAGADTLRWWSNAAALARDGATVLLVGADEGPGRALRDWRQADAARDELAARRALAFPPAVRVGALRGTRAEVKAALDVLDGVEQLRVDGPAPDLDANGEPVADDAVVATLRFAYAAGGEVARRLKAELVRGATARRAARGGRSAPRASTLRVHLDEPGRF